MNPLFTLGEEFRFHDCSRFRKKAGDAKLLFYHSFVPVLMSLAAESCRFFFFRPTPSWLSPGRSTSLYLPEMNCEKHAKPSLEKAAFFFLRYGRCRTRLGPYNCVSSEKLSCTRTRVVRKKWQIIMQPNTNKKTTKPPQTTSDPQIPQPDLRFARFAFRANQNSEATKNGAGPNENAHTDLP